MKKNIIKKVKKQIIAIGGPFNRYKIPKPVDSTLTFSVNGYKGHYDNKGEWKSENK